MTDKQQALRDLLAKVKAGNCHATELPFWKVWVPEGEDGRLAYVAANAYNGSLDAAFALHNAVVSEWRPRIELGGFNSYNMARPADMWTVILWHTDSMSIHALEGASGSSKDPARAWLIAILAALIAKGEA